MNKAAKKTQKRCDREPWLVWEIRGTGRRVFIGKMTAADAQKVIALAKSKVA